MSTTTTAAQETRSSEIAAARLRAAGYDVTTGVAKAGVVGVLRNDDGPTAMLRADAGDRLARSRGAGVARDVVA